ncbi:MAG: hypothetical protein ACXU8O_03000 [Asticcacaulis sp.]
MLTMNLSLDFAFEGFRIIREKPKLVPFWGVILLIGNGLATVVMVAIGGPAMDRMAAVSGTTDPAVLMTIYPTVMAAYALSAPILLVTHAIISCAAFRAVWGEKDDRFGYVRFGGQELRQIAVMVLYFLVYCGLIMADLITAGALGSIAGDKAVAVAPVLLMAGLVPVLGIMLRLSLCGVQSFDRNMIDLFGSWRLTRRQGWNLFGGYLVTAVMAAFVAILCMGIFGAITIAINNGSWSAVDQWFFLARQDMTSLHAYLKPLMIAWLIVANAVIGPLIAALASGAQAAAYRTLAGQVPDAGV